MEFIEYQVGTNQFREYMLNNFVVNKRFLSIKKNLDYKKRTFRLYMRTMVLCNKWYVDTIEKRYTPGGNGAIEAENHFVYLSDIFHNVVERENSGTY